MKWRKTANSREEMPDGSMIQDRDPLTVPSTRRNPVLWSMIISGVALIVGVVCFLTNSKLTELPSDVDDEKIAETEKKLIEEEESSSLFVSQEIFNDLSGEYWFLSGAGAWQTSLFLYSDGTFCGLYQDTDTNTVYRCVFQGSLELPTVIDDYTLCSKILNISYEEPRFVKQEGENVVISSGPYGLENAESVYFYLPGYPISDLSESEYFWLSAEREEFWDINQEDALGMSLPCYAIRNTLEDGEYLFAKIPDSFISDKNVPGFAEYFDSANIGSLSEVTDLFGETALEYYTVDAGILPFHFLYYKNGDPALLAVGDIYSVDVDGDGIPELINNAIWADGGRATRIFKRTEEGGILCGNADDLLDEKFDYVGIGSQYSYYLPEENKVDIFFWKEDKQAYDEKKYTIDLSKIEMLPYDSSIDFASINQMPRLEDIVSRIAGNRDAADVSYNWNNTVDFISGASALIQMAIDSTKRYEIYGVMSTELGTYGMILNDRIGGEDHWNLVYDSWIYTAIPADKPTLSYEDEQLIFTYVYGQDENGKSLTRSYIVDCGYDTGLMELK